MMPAHATSIWHNENAVARLQELHGQGKTFSQIANMLSEEFSVRLTRNACIGKSQRLSLPERPPQAVAAMTDQNRLERLRRKAERTRQRYASRRLAEGFKVRERAPRKETAPERMAADADPLHATLETLSWDGCRFPYGDGPFTFCGCQVLAGKPYCAAHYRLTHTSDRLTPQEVTINRRLHKFKLVAEAA